MNLRGISTMVFLRLAVLAMLLVAVPAGVALAQSAIDPHDDLVGWWDGDGSGAVAQDIQGVNPGTLEPALGGATRAPGHVGQAFSLDGVDDYVTIPDSTELRLGKDQTVLAWYKWAGGGANDTRRLVGKGGSGSRNYGLWFYPQGKRVQFQFHPGCNIQYNLAIFDADIFHLTVGTYDGAEIKLYHNGALLTAAACTATPPTSADPLTIGWANAGVAPYQSPFDGLIDEAQIYSRALSDLEIQAIFNAGSAGMVKPGSGGSSSSSSSGSSGRSRGGGRSLPDPQTWLLMLSGLGLLGVYGGYSYWRRNRKTA